MDEVGYKCLVFDLSCVCVCVFCFVLNVSIHVYTLPLTCPNKVRSKYSPANCAFLLEERGRIQCWGSAVSLLLLIRDGMVNGLTGALWES